MADLGTSIASGAAAGAAAGSIVPGIGTAIGAVGGGLINTIGGIIGAIAGGADRTAAQAALNQANQLIQQLNLPPSQATPVILQAFQNAGIVDPKVLQQVQQAGTAYANIAPDTANINAQQQALQALQQRGTVGLNAEDRANLQQIRNQVGADAEGQRKQILQNMQAMGQGGGGAALAAQLNAAQSSANTESQQANAQGATASARALQAIQSAGSLSGDIRNQDYSIASNKAAAQDQMNRFNVGNTLAVNQANQTAQNAAQYYNQANAQNIGNQNTQQANNELYRQIAGQQTDFANQVGLAQAKAGALTGQAANYNQQAQNIGSQISGAAGGLATTAGGIGQYINNSNNQNFLNQFLQQYANNNNTTTPNGNLTQSQLASAFTNATNPTS